MASGKSTRNAFNTTTRIVIDSWTDTSEVYYEGTSPKTHYDNRSKANRSATLGAQPFFPDGKPVFPPIPDYLAMRQSQNLPVGDHIKDGFNREYEYMANVGNNSSQAYGIPHSHGQFGQNRQQTEPLPAANTPRSWSVPVPGLSEHHVNWQPSCKAPTPMFSPRRSSSPPTQLRSDDAVPTDQGTDSSGNTRFSLIHDSFANNSRRTYAAPRAEKEDQTMPVDRSQ